MARRPDLSSMMAAGEPVSFGRWIRRMLSGRHGYCARRRGVELERRLGAVETMARSVGWDFSTAALRRLRTPRISTVRPPMICSLVDIVEKSATRSLERRWPCRRGGCFARRSQRRAQGMPRVLAAKTPVHEPPTMRDRIRGRREFPGRFVNRHAQAREPPSKGWSEVFGHRPRARRHRV